MIIWHEADQNACLKELQTSSSGLSGTQAAERLARDGEN